LIAEFEASQSILFELEAGSLEQCKRGNDLLILEVIAVRKNAGHSNAGNSYYYNVD